MMKKLSGPPDRIKTYFLAEISTLSVITVSGIIYNIGMVAGPWFEGKLAQCLLNIFNKKNTFSDMLKLALAYVAVIGIVQISRYIKRLYVRHFANHLNRSMKHVIYSNLVYKEKRELEQENVGAIMTKAISDVEACVEGLRKFTTEVFDTGVVMAGYFVFLLTYDWRLTIISMIFPPLSYLIADQMKKIVQRSNAVYKESSGQLSAATLDRVQGALTYRVFGCEEERNADYEAHLSDYERKAVRANIWVSAMQPLYKVISMISVIFILYFGAGNVMGNGWTQWDIAAFTAFLSCFTKLSLKSSKAAKLFNAVQKAQVSWKRIKPLMKEEQQETAISVPQVHFVEASDLGFSYPDTFCSSDNTSSDSCSDFENSVNENYIFRHLNLTAHQGQIIGITGPVASGKSTLGKTFLCEFPYLGSLRVDGRELSGLERETQKSLVGYLGHDPEILSASIRENVAMGDDIDVEHFLKMVCLDKEISAMSDGPDSQVGSGGIRLSGGQQQRLALARVLAHHRPILVLDDPFSALDQKTEAEVFAHLKSLSADHIIFLISHRLYLFPQFDQIIWMEDKVCSVSDHGTLMKSNEIYANLYHSQVARTDISNSVDTIDAIPWKGDDTHEK